MSDGESVVHKTCACTYCTNWTTFPHHDGPVSLQEGSQRYMAAEMSADDATKPTEAPAVMTVQGEEGKIEFGNGLLFLMFSS